MIIKGFNIEEDLDKTWTSTSWARPEDIDPNVYSLLVEQDGEEYTVSLWTEFGDCPSGWTKATYAMHSVSRGHMRRIGFTEDGKAVYADLDFTEVEPITVDDLRIVEKSGYPSLEGYDSTRKVWSANHIDNSILTVEPYGNGDEWYPLGYACIKKGAFN